MQNTGITKVISITERALQTPEHFHTFAKLIQPFTFVVLSEPSHTSSQITHMLHEATKGKVEVFFLLEKLRGVYQSLIKTLFTHPHTIIKEICDSFCLLQDILQGVFHIKECSVRTTDYAHSLGRKFSCIVLNHYLKEKGLDTQIVNLADSIITEHQTSVLIESSIKNIAKQMKNTSSVVVIPGGIATTREKAITILNPRGETFTATLLAVALDIPLVEVWTDTEGIFTADPGIVPDSSVIPRIGAREVMELSYFGSQLLHPHALSALTSQKISVVMKNILHPQGPGTKIEPDSLSSENLITGLSSITNVALINVEGNGMAGTVGVASRVFHSLAQSHTNIIMISQASSENSICLLCREKDADHAVTVLQEGLQEELHSGRIQNIVMRSDLEIIAVVGANMKGNPGMAGKIFHVLGKENINIFAIAQGASEINISLVVAKDQGKQALRLIHRTFFPKRDRN